MAIQGTAGGLSRQQGNERSGLTPFHGTWSLGGSGWRSYAWGYKSSKKGVIVIVVIVTLRITTREPPSSGFWPLDRRYA